MPLDIQASWCLSQARIKWEGCGRKASGIKMGDVGGGSLISRDEVAPTLIVMCLPLLSSLAP